jgi:hypothetical protein
LSFSGVVARACAMGRLATKRNRYFFRASLDGGRSRRHPHPLHRPEGPAPSTPTVVFVLSEPRSTRRRRCRVPPHRWAENLRFHCALPAAPPFATYKVKSGRDLRLTGLTVVGSIPTAALGSALLVALAVVKYRILRLSVGSCRRAKEVGPMTKTNQLWWLSVFEAVWSVGTRVAAGALST